MKQRPDQLIRTISALTVGGGFVGSPLPITGLAVPSQARSEGNRLLWPVEPLKGARIPRISRALADFILLADAPDRALVEYARTYGFLGLCEAHELPMLHPEFPGTQRTDGRAKGGPFCHPAIRLRPELE